MSKSDVFENALLKLLFNGTAIANLADNAAVAPLASLYVALHTADPGEGGSQTTSETAYSGYGRQAVARSSGGFTVTGSVVNPVAAISYPVCVASPGADLTFFSIGTLASGAGVILYSGPLDVSIPMAIGVVPTLKNNSSVAED